MAIAYNIVMLAGIVLLVTGLYFQLNKKKLNSDPVLIAACYLWGSFNLAACLYY